MKKFLCFMCLIIGAGLFIPAEAEVARHAHGGQVIRAGASYRNHYRPRPYRRPAYILPPPPRCCYYPYADYRFGCDGFGYRNGIYINLGVPIRF